MEKAIGEIAATDDIIFAPKQTKIQIPLFNKNIFSDISEDFVLPDYKPEIRRLLRITPYISMPSTYVNMSAAEFTGNISWVVLYVANDGTLTSATLASPFEITAEYDSDKASSDGNYSAYDEIRAENVIGRVTAPRKLNIKCRLVHSVKVFGDRSCEAELFGNTDNADAVKRLMRSVKSSRIQTLVDDSLELYEPLNASSNEKIIATGGNVDINDTELTANGFDCRGAVVLKLLSVKEDGTVSSSERKIPFSSTIMADLDGDGWNCTACGKIAEISIEESESELSCRARIVICLNAQKTEFLEYTKDIFSTKNECEYSSETIYVPSVLYSGKSGFIHDGSAEIDGLPEGAEAIDVTVNAVPESITFENERYVLNGKCKYNVLYAANGEYSVRETEFPFRREIKEGEENPKDFIANICVNSAKVRKEGENMAFSSDLSANVTVLTETPVNAVLEADFGEALDNAESTAAFTVAYPAPFETLWSVAKRYLTDPSALAAANGIETNDFDAQDSLSATKYLII